MQSAWFDATIAWISAHPHAAGGLVFLIALCDALAVVGIAVPALPLLFAVGTLIGLGHLDGPYALLCAAAGAFVGDALSLLEGRVEPFNHFLNRDEAQHRTSISKLRDMGGFKYLLTQHYGYTAEIDQAFSSWSA